MQFLAWLIGAIKHSGVWAIVTELITCVFSWINGVKLGNYE